MTANIIDFKSPKHFVVVYLLMPGAEQTVVNNFPNCWAEWKGDTLNIYQDGMSTPRASYHRSVVMVMEEHGLPAGLNTPKPPQNGPTSPVRTSGTPAVPDVEQTQQIAPVPVPKPSVAELQEQHLANLTAVVRNLPKPNIPKATVQRSFRHVERRTPPGIESALDSLVESTSADPAPSRWQSLKQIVRRSDGEQIEMSYRSGNSSVMGSPTSHRLPKFFKTRKWARRTKRAVVLAFALYAASLWPEPV